VLRFCIEKAAADGAEILVEGSGKVLALKGNRYQETPGDSGR